MTPKKTGAAAIACGLALTMSLSMGFASTASAATVTFDKDLQSQTVSNRTFIAYKLATVKTTDGTTTYTFVSDGIRTAIKGILTDLGVADVDKADTDVAISGLIAGLDNSKKVEFASKIADKAPGMAPSTTINGNSGALDDFGYYVITETTAGSVVKAAPFLLETSDKDVTTTLKSSQPSIGKDIVSDDKKDSKYDDVNIGDDVKFELNDMKVPDTYGYNTYKYIITDTMSTGLTLTKAQVDALTLTIGGKSVAAGDGTYTVTVNGTKAGDLAADWSAKGATIVITFNEKYFIGTYGDVDSTTGKVSYTQTPAAGSDIKVNFSATLNDGATVAVPESNTVKLTYTNDTDKTTDSTEHKVYVYTYGIEVDKTFSDGKDLFDKVEFGLTGDKDIYVTGSAGKYTVVTKDTAGAKPASSGLKLDASGHIEIKGLDAGSYVLKETKVPTGYESDGPKTIVIKPNYGDEGAAGKAGQTVTVDKDTDNDGYVNGSVVNTPQTFHLPQTGAAGVILLPLIGMGAMAGAAITLRRKAQSNN